MAALGSSQFVGSQTLPVRPLSAGMVTEGSESELKPGAVFWAENFEATEKGLRRSGTMFLANSIPVPLDPDEIQKDFFVVKDTSGDSYPVILTNKYLYSFNPGTEPHRIPWLKDFTISSTYENDGNTILVLEGTGYRISIGDLVEGDARPACQIGGVWENEGKTYLGIPEIVGGFGGSCRVLKSFRGTEVSWSLGRGFAWLVDGKSGMVFRFDGRYLRFVPVVNSLDDSTETMSQAKWVTIFKERLYFGAPMEPDGIHRVRVRWSEVLGWGPGAQIESPAENYQDLGGNGEITGLIGIEDLLIAFTTDRIFYGKETTISILPYAFIEIQAGSVSSIGPRGFAGLMGSVIFVGPDDIYTIGLDQGYPQLGKIGSPVANRMFPMKNPESVILCPDPVNSRVLVGVSGQTTGVINQVWIWNYKSKGWSILSTDKSLRGISATDFIDELLYEDAPEVWDYESSPLTNENYAALVGDFRGQRIFFLDSLGFCYSYEADAKEETVSVLETQDYDFGAADIQKTVYEVRLRERDSESPIQVRVSGSTDCGKTWKFLGQRTFQESTEIDFRLTGYVIRFRLEFRSSGDPWTLLELTLRLKARGGGQ